MVSLPQESKERRELDSRLGIKSSLSSLSSVVALCYALYRANSKKPTIDYADEIVSEGKRQLCLKPHLEQEILGKYGVNGEQIRRNPLLKSQLEALQVGISLMFKLGTVRFVDYPETDTKERTGGARYRKEIFFSTNMSILDLYVSSWSDSIQSQELRLWLIEQPSDSEFSMGLKRLLTVFSEDTLYRIRAENNHNIIFQQEGIYNEILKGNNVVAKDAFEDVG